MSGMKSPCTKISARARGHERTSLRRVWGDESVTKREGSSVAGRMLHRPPPLIRIFLPPSGVLSSRIVSHSGEAAKMAAIVPAAPAPMTATRFRARPWP